MNLSLAVLALIGGIDARHHHHHHQRQLVQFVPIADYDADSIKLELGETNKIADYQPIKGVTLLESDPIHGSLGPLNKAKREDLTPEQQFEWDQRRMKPLVFSDDEDVKASKNSLKIAEKLTGKKMPKPSDPTQMEKVKPTPEYHHADSDDEEDDTVETRKSIKTAEQALKHRFFINARDEKDYQEKLKNGQISKEEASFQEKNDGSEVGEDPKQKAEKVQAKKEKAQKAAEAEETKKEEDKKPAKQKKEEAKEKAKEEAAAKAKEESPEEKEKAKEDEKKTEAASAEKKDAAKKPFVPPELAGAMVQMW